MCITEACEEPTSAGVWWRDDAEWKQYDTAMAAAIQQGLTDRANRVELGNLVSSMYARGAQYVVDLSSMKQINVATGFTRDVKVVKAPTAGVIAPPVNASDDLARVKEEVLAWEETIQSFKEMVMKLETKFLALKLKVLGTEADRVPAKVTCPLQVTPLVRGQPGDYWEIIGGRVHLFRSCDSAGEHYSDSLSDDDY